MIIVRTHKSSILRVSWREGVGNSEELLQIFTHNSHAGMLMAAEKAELALTAHYCPWQRCSYLMHIIKLLQSTDKHLFLAFMKQDCMTIW